MKNPQSNFNDLENSVPLEESNDDLLDKRGTNTGASLDAKKVKEAWQLEMEYYDKMDLFDKEPFRAIMEKDRQDKALLKGRWVDIDK